jgi:hypothetical protein
MNLFKEKSLKEILEGKKALILVRAQDITDYQILNVDLNELATNMTNQYKLQVLEIDFDDRDVDIVMKQMSARSTPSLADAQKGRSNECALVKFTFKIKKGISELLGASPSSANFKRNVQYTINDKKFTIYYQTLCPTTDLTEHVKNEVKTEIREIVDSSKTLIEAINQEISQYNESLAPLLYKKLVAAHESLTKEIQTKNDLKNF